MAYHPEDMRGQRYELSYTPPSRSGGWFLAAAVFVLVLILGLALLGGIMGDPAATDAVAPAQITDDTTPVVIE